MVHVVDRFLQAALPATTTEKACGASQLPSSSLKREAKTACERAVKTVETPHQKPVGIGPHRSDAEIRLTMSLGLYKCSATAIIGSTETVRTAIQWGLAFGEDDANHMRGSVRGESEMGENMTYLKDSLSRPLQSSRWQG
ncbi:hypothetical protein PAXRUDRAFT_17350 [Paxillus rubicundulus Ve08.2h10]|uniref:Uncharacterized protein n=1 Tax=Paxillus rubicundulus Ve08.2h10 TaxID=930991 RepID=A0A0D0CQL6_9AGAM|nr:hypothetical protein PAXRUDRAFT_17350 [Paxillus rubicundulus Ve08.2h10]